MATSQQHSNLQGKPPSYRWVFLTIVLIFTACGAVLWLSSIEHVIADSWASIAGAVFTVIGVVIALFQLLAPSLSPPSLATGKTSSSPALVSSTDAQQSIDRRKGTLRVHGSQYLCGTTISICSGFDAPSLHADAAANVIEQYAGYVADFYELEPGNYTIYIDSHGPTAKVTVYARRVTEIDWRYISLDKKQGLEEDNA